MEKLYDEWAKKTFKWNSNRQKTVMNIEDAEKNNINEMNFCTLEKIIVEGVVKKEYDCFCAAVGEFASKIRSLHITTDLFSNKNLQNNIYMSIHNGKTIPLPLEVSNNTRKEILSEWLINYNNNCN